MKPMQTCYHGMFNEDGEYRPHISEVDSVYQCSICKKIDASGKYELLEEFFIGKSINAPDQFFNDIPDYIIEKIINKKLQGG